MGSGLYVDIIEVTGVVWLQMMGITMGWL